MIKGLVCLALLAGCGAHKLEPGFEADLIHADGCGDIVLYAMDDDDSVALLVDGGGGAVVEAVRGDHVVVRDYTLAPTGTLQVTAEIGESITQSRCSDVVFPTRVDATYRAVAGTARLTVTPQENGLARASLHLEEVMLQNDAGDTVHVPVFDFANILVGWFAG